MIEPSMISTIVQGGSLALLAVIVVWSLTHGIPKVLELIKSMQTEYLTDLRQIRQENREDRNQLNTSISTLGRSIDQNTEATRQLASNCRKS